MLSVLNHHLQSLITFQVMWLLIQKQLDSLCREITIKPAFSVGLALIQLSLLDFEIFQAKRLKEVKFIGACSGSGTEIGINNPWHKLLRFSYYCLQFQLRAWDRGKVMPLESKTGGSAAAGGR